MTERSARILTRLERLDDLLRRDPVRGKAELAKHLEGELTLTPLPSVARERRAEIRGRAKLNSLLEGQEAVLQYVGCGGALWMVGEPLAFRVVLDLPPSAGEVAQKAVGPLRAPCRRLRDTESDS